MAFPKRILLTGANGFVGRALGASLKLRGDQVVAVVRDPRASWKNLSFASEVVSWEQLAAGIQGVDAIVHLAGETVAQRWSASTRRKILSSRVSTAAALEKSCAVMKGGKKPSVFVSASAIGFYGDRGEEPLDEQSRSGTDFLAEVCRAWEHSAEAFRTITGRVVTLRIGLVLGKGGGALQKMLPPFRVGLGGRLGSGRQWMSWIHLDDLVTLLIRAIDSDQMNGVYNAVAPEPLRNEEFTGALAETLNRSARIPAPEWALRLAMGEASVLLLGSQRVVPKRLLGEGFTYRYPKIIEALRASVRK